MNGTRIKALHATKVPASMWAPLSLSRGCLGLSPKHFLPLNKGDKVGFTLCGAFFTPLSCADKGVWGEEHPG